jgi:hypothetical protein
MELRIIHHRSEKVEQMRVEFEDDGHAGGDLILRKLRRPDKGTGQPLCLAEGRASQRRDVPRGTRVSQDKDLPASVELVGRGRGEAESNTL